MIMDYAKKYVGQDSQVVDEFHLPGCAHFTVAPDSCDLPGWPQFEDYGFSYRTTVDSALPWDELKRQIDSNKPFAFSWHLGEHVGHMMVVIGYTDDPQRTVHYNQPDPNGDIYHTTYEGYVTEHHWDDFYDITRHETQYTER
jgi:hypothetical protein